MLLLGSSFLPCVGVFHLLSFERLNVWKDNCVNLFLSWIIFVSPSMVIESFAIYSSLGRNLSSLWVCMTFTQDLLAFTVSGEKSSVILKYKVCLYILLDLFPLLLSVFILCFVHSVF